MTIRLARSHQPLVDDTGDRRGDGDRGRRVADLARLDHGELLIAGHAVTDIHEDALDLALDAGADEDVTIGIVRDDGIEREHGIDIVEVRCHGLEPDCLALLRGERHGAAPAAAGRDLLPVRSCETSAAEDSNEREDAARPSVWSVRQGGGTFR